MQSKKMQEVFRKEMTKIKGYVQGKPIEEVQREYGLYDIAKLASNENHFGFPSKVKEAIVNEIDNINYYPDGSGKKLKEELAKKHNCKPEQIVLGTGGEQTLWLLSMVLLNKGENIITTNPTFDIYSIAANFLGAKIKKVPLTNKWEYDADGILSAIDKKTKIIWITTPNNPTGSIMRKKDVDKLIKRVPENIVLVFDEAYYEYASVFKEYPKDNLRKLKTRKNIAILRTFSKIYALAGLRIGYIFTNSHIAEKMNALNLTFGVNRLAEVAAKASIRDKKYLQRVITNNKDALEKFEKYFTQRKMPFAKPFGNFIWVDTGEDTRVLFEKLQKEGVITRPGFLWGWDSFLRISTGTKKQTTKFMKAFDKVEVKR